MTLARSRPGPCCPSLTRVLTAVLMGVSVAAVAWGETLDRPLSPEDCVRIALERNPDILLAADAAASARGRSRQAWGGVLPSVSATGTYSFDSSEGPNVVAGVPTFGETESETRFALLQLDQPLSWSAIQSLRSGRRSAAASDTDIDTAKQDVALNVKIRYYEYVKAKRLHEVRLESVDLREQQLERAQTLFEVGSVARNDVLQAQVNLEGARLDEILARNTVELERSRLAQLMGISVDTRFETSDEMGVPAPAVIDSAAAWEEARARRPDLRAARLRVQAGAVSLSSARGGRYPSIFGRLSRTWINQTSLSRLTIEDEIQESSTDIEPKRWTATVGVSWNFFDGMLTEGRITEAKAQLVSGEDDLRRLELAAALDVKEAILLQRAAMQSIASAGKAVDLAEENLKLAEERYELGSGTLLELDQAQVDLVDARRSLVEATAGLKVAAARLDRARGRPVQ